MYVYFIVAKLTK